MSGLGVDPWEWSIGESAGKLEVGLRRRMPGKAGAMCVIQASFSTQPAMQSDDKDEYLDVQVCENHCEAGRTSTVRLHDLRLATPPLPLQAILLHLGHLREHRRRCEIAHVPTLFWLPRYPQGLVTRSRQELLAGLASVDFTIKTLSDGTAMLAVVDALASDECVL
jgi:hypothetical protein